MRETLILFNMELTHLGLEAGGLHFYSYFLIFGNSKIPKNKPLFKLHELNEKNESYFFDKWTIYILTFASRFCLTKAILTYHFDHRKNSSHSSFKLTLKFLSFRNWFQRNCFSLCIIYRQISNENINGFSILFGW